MSNLTFADSHNMVVYLEKSEANADFAEIVDFLNASPIRYALNVSPTIYVSYIEQFWSTAKTKTVNNETQIRAKVDGKTIVITESSVRRDLHFDDEDGTVTPLFPSMLASQAMEGEGSRQPTEPQHTPTIASPSHVEPIPIWTYTLVADETVYEERGDSVERAATTAASLDAEQDSGNINRTQSTAIPNDPFPQGAGSGGSPRRQDTMGDAIAQTRFERASKQSYDSPLGGVNTPRSDEDIIKLKELMEIYTKLSDRVLDLENGRNEIDQDEGISWFQEDAETQGRYGHDIEVNNASTSITTASINITTVEPVTTASAPITTAGVSISTAEQSTPPTTTTTVIEDEDLTIAQTLMKMRNEKSKEKSKEKGVSSETATRLTRGVIMKEASETATRSIVPPQQQLDPKDKEELQAELEEAERSARQREEEANVALIEEWDNVQAMMDADYELYARLQVEEQGGLTIEERSRLFVELMDKRKKHFARLRAEEQRRKPPTKNQKRNQMCTYLKNMVGYKHTQLKNKSFEEIQKLFDKEMKRVNTFVPMDSDVVKGSNDKAEDSKKRTRKGLDEESVKRQKVEDDAEKAELKACLEIVPGDDSVVNIEPLATKSPIVDWETQILGEELFYYQIKRADESYKVYKVFSAMLDDFDRQDVLDLYRLVKERFETTSLEGYDRLLWGDLITLFEPSEEDEI
ncbi:hypothetical protein Tco_0169556 [Tanacetum coccineum]